MLLASACATGRGEPVTREGGKAREAATVRSDAPTPTLVGKRCTNGRCRCRTPGDAKEDPPPREGYKRIEIRMSAMNGSISLDSPSVGHFEHEGPQEACFYVDLPVSQVHDFRMHSAEALRGNGMTPMLHISEYGPAGPFWYDILHVACGEGARSCDQGLAHDWGKEWLAVRKRGRLEPCGSIVVNGLAWSTSGGQSVQDGRMLRDFDTGFSLEVKRFATQYPPGAAECHLKR